MNTINCQSWENNHKICQAIPLVLWKKKKGRENEHNQLSIMGQLMHVSLSFEISEASKIGN